jgi:Protein of unknown function (DUF3553)
MEYRPGTWVRHPTQESWGTGEVLSQDEGKVRILFPAVGEKLIDVRFVVLEEADAPVGGGSRPQLRARRGVNITELEQLCRQFHEQFVNRRSTTDDGRMALKVLDDMERRGDLSKATARQLFSWTHTGASYTEGIDLAQRICRLIYGRIPTQAEVERL